MPEPIEERVDALPSEDNGNVPIDDIKPEAPKEEAPVIPAKEVEPAAPAEPEVESGDGDDDGEWEEA